MSSQRDSERAMLALERRELAEYPQAEPAELARIYRSKGLPADLSRYVAEQLTARDPLAAHAEAELGIDPEQLAHPGHAAVASFGSFMAGAVLPLFGASHLVPYAGANPAERLLARVTLSFFDRYVLGQAGALAAMTRDGNVTGAAALVSGGQPPP